MGRTEKRTPEKRRGNRPEDQSAAALLLREIAERAQLPEALSPQETLFAVTCALRQRLTGGAAEHLADELPRAIQPTVRGCPRRHPEQPEIFGRDELLDRVATSLDISPEQAETITRAIFGVLRQWLPLQEAEHVASQLPVDIRELWMPPKGKGTTTPTTTTTGTTTATTTTATMTGPSPAAADEQPQGLAQRILENVERSGLLPTDVTEQQAVTAVLCTLSQRLTKGEARDLLQGLPAGLHPLLETCILHRQEPAQRFNRWEFLRRVAHHLHISEEESEAVTSAVFSAVVRVVSPKEVNDVASQLPGDLKVLWLDAAATARLPDTAN